MLKSKGLVPKKALELQDSKFGVCRSFDTGNRCSIVCGSKCKHSCHAKTEANIHLHVHPISS